MTFREFMEAAGYEPIYDSIMGGTSYLWYDASGDQRAWMWKPDPPPEMWWTILVRLREMERV